MATALPRPVRPVLRVWAKASFLQEPSVVALNLRIFSQEHQPFSLGPGCLCPIRPDPLGRRRPAMLQRLETEL